MTGISVTVATTTSPGDTSPLETVTGRGLSADDVIGVIGKTEGNGCVNDFSRTLAATVWEPLLAETAVTVFSGGTEGVISPHVTLLVRDVEEHVGHDRGLVAAVGRTRPIAAEELGRRPQVDLVAGVVRELVDGLAVAADEVHLVLVKCPLIDPAGAAAARRAGTPALTDDGYESMGRSRAASSLGIALALGECDGGDVDAALEGTASVWSSRASASAGAELRDCHVMVLAVSSAVHNPLRAVHGAMDDAIDLQTVLGLLDQVREDAGEVVQVFVKAEADPSGTVRGFRHTMLTDSDLNSTRHARAAVGGVVAAARGHGAVYVSGGAEHQGPVGGGSITVVYRVPAVGDGAS